MTNALTLQFKNPDGNSNHEDSRANHPWTQRRMCKVLSWILATFLFFWLLMCFMSIEEDAPEYFCPGTMNLYDEHIYKPEQIHLSLGANETELFITWSTKEPISSEVNYYRSFGNGSLGDLMRVPAEETAWISTETDAKFIRATRTQRMEHYTYRARLTKLEPDSHYIYRIVSINSISSRSYEFFTRNLSDPLRSINIAFYGDLGLVNGQSIPQLIQDVDNHMYDFIIHNGDFAYDLNTHHGQYGDDFMRLIEPIAARVPYQTSVGNHEIADQFLHYDQRFTMVNSAGVNTGERNNLFYSFNAGPIHFVSISTEFYYFLDYLGMKPLSKQWDWLNKDLSQATSKEERLKRPWIIVFGHRPMYCSSRDKDDCSKDSCILRKGLPFIGSYALEKLFYDYGVDVEIYSHEHQYERFLPIYNGKVYNGTDRPDEPYHNPRAPVHIISGSAGCQERIDPFTNVTAPGSVKRVADYGYSRLEATRCELRFEQVSSDQNGLVVDQFVVSKTRQNFPIKSEEIQGCD